MKTLTVPEQHQRRIALQTLQFNQVGAIVMGGPDHRQAVQILRKFGHKDLEIRVRLETAGHDRYFIDNLLKGA